MRCVIGLSHPSTDRYGLAEEGFVKRKKKQLLVEMKQGGGGSGGEQSSGTMDYVDPLRALEAMGARDIKVGTGKARPRRRGGEDGIHERERALRCPGLLPCSNLVIGVKAERERDQARGEILLLQWTE